MSDCEEYIDCKETEPISYKEREYKIGTCYSCQKCLYCGIKLIRDDECNCDKTLKPTNSKKKTQPGFVRNGVFDPNTCHSVLVTLLHFSNDLYKFNSDFSKRFNFTLCAKCNSQLTRDQSNYKKNEENKSRCQKLGVRNESERNNNNQVLTNKKRKITTKQSNDSSELDNTTKSDVAFRFKLVIKTPDSTKPAKAITLEKKPDDYYEFENFILQRVCESAGLVFRTEIELSYKAEKGIGTGTILEEEEDFEEFIQEHYRLTSSNKVLMIIVTIRKKDMTKRKKKNIAVLDDDDDESISEETEVASSSKQKNKKKSFVPKEANLNEIDLMKGEIHKKLKEKHECDIHKTGYCYIKDDRHLPLTTLHLSMWTDEIYKNHCDYETPPPHPNFGMGNSLKVTSRSTSPTNSSMSAHSNEFSSCYSHYSQHIPLPNVYPYYLGWPPYPQSHPPSQHLSSHLPSYPSYPLFIPNPSTTSTLESISNTPNTSYDNTKPSEPSIKEFLEELDKQYGEGRYTNYLQKFEKEEITVSQIAGMSPDILLHEFGVEIAGRRLNLIKEAKKFV